MQGILVKQCLLSYKYTLACHSALPVQDYVADSHELLCPISHRNPPPSPSPLSCQPMPHTCTSSKFLGRLIHGSQGGEGLLLRLRAFWVGTWGIFRQLMNISKTPVCVSEAVVSTEDFPQPEITTHSFPLLLRIFCMLKPQNTQIGTRRTRQICM